MEPTGILSDVDVDKIPVGSISSTIRLKFFFAPGSNQEGAFKLLDEIFSFSSFFLRL